MPGIPSTAGVFSAGSTARRNSEKGNASAWEGYADVTMLLGKDAKHRTPRHLMRQQASLMSVWKGSVTGSHSNLLGLPGE